MSEAAAKKDIQKLQRAIVDGLEDVKAHDIRVFNTEHLSPLFERVMVASGNSNRQTKAIAASVRDKVREAGFAKPRIEGEENGEWIIVDCGAAVAHVMQPAIRQYYNLEEIWGEKPVHLKGPAVRASARRAAAQQAAEQAPAAPASASAKKTAAKKVPAKSALAKTAAPKAATKKTPRAQAAAGKAVSASVKKTAAKKTAAPKAASSRSTAARKPVAGAASPSPTRAPAKSAARPARTTAPRKPRG